MMTSVVFQQRHAVLYCVIPYQLLVETQFLSVTLECIFYSYFYEYLAYL